MSVEDIVELLAINLIGVVPDDTSIITTTNRGEPAVMNEKSLPGKAYKNIAKRIMGEEVPLLELDHKSIAKKIKAFFAKNKEQ